MLNKAGPLNLLGVMPVGLFSKDHKKVCSTTLFSELSGEILDGLGGCSCYHFMESRQASVAFQLAIQY